MKKNIDKENKNPKPLSNELIKALQCLTSNKKKELVSRCRLIQLLQEKLHFFNTPLSTTICVDPILNLFYDSD